MTNLREIKIYNVTLNGYKPTTIQVRKMQTEAFICYFLDPIVISEFKTIGFKVCYINGIENFSLTGNLNLNYAENIWEKFIEKKDKPDIDFAIKELLE